MTTAVLIASMYASHTLISYPVVSKFGLSNVPAAVIAVFGTIVAVLLSLLTLAQVVSVKINGGFDMAELWKLGILDGDIYVCGRIFFSMADASRFRP